MAVQTEGGSDSNGLVEQHLSLVDHIVHQVTIRFPRHVDRDELRGAGAAGLVDAARRYDPSSGVPFARYAAIRIRGEVIDAARTRDWATRRLRRDLRVIEDTVSELEELLQRAPTDDEVAARMGVPVDEVCERRAAQLTVTLLTLDRPTAGSEADHQPLADLVAESDIAWLPDLAVEQNELVATLRRAVNALPGDLRAVLVAHQFDGRRLSDIADDMGLTEARVSQLRHEGLHAIQAYFATQFDGVSDVPSGAPGKRRRRAYVAQMRSQHVLGNGFGARVQQVYGSASQASAV